MRRPPLRAVDALPAPTRQNEIDPWYLFTVLGPSMVTAARYARKDARHYNGFNVGGCALVAAVVQDTVHEVSLFTGANQNLAEGENPSKVCAEQIILQKAKNAGFNKLIAMVVSGPPQPDTQSGRTLEVLDTCGKERALYFENKEARDMVEDDALHVAVHPDEDLFIIQETNELLTAHALPGELPPQIVEDPEFGVWRRAGPLYLREVEYVESHGEEPLRPLVATQAITGQLEIAA